MLSAEIRSRGIGAPNGPRGVIRFWPANAVGDDIELYADDGRARVLARAAAFKARHDDSAILRQALGDRLFEALAEHLHERVRKEFWGYAPDEDPSNQDLMAERYRGIRPAPGYPACPDHTEKRVLFELLGAKQSAGIGLTESCAMTPAASISGYHFAHPESRYFGLGRIGRDQVEDYARRKAMAPEEIERWLPRNLGYEPLGNAA